MVVLGGGAGSYERGTPVAPRYSQGMRVRGKLRVPTRLGKDTYGGKVSSRSTLKPRKYIRVGAFRAQIPTRCLREIVYYGWSIMCITECSTHICNTHSLPNNQNITDAEYIRNKRDHIRNTHSLSNTWWPPCVPFREGLVNARSEEAYRVTSLIGNRHPPYRATSLIRKRPPP